MNKFFRIGSLTASLVVAAVVGTTSAMASGSGGGGAAGVPTTPSSKADVSLEERLQKTYAAGLKYKARAWKAEQKAESAKTEKNKNRQLGRAQKDYKKAQDEFAKVLQENPQDYKAANELGYVLRKQGHFKKAIGAYNYALQLFPEFDQAIEYRAEAFVATGFYDEAKDAYMHLFRSNSELAEELLASMRKWRDELDSEEVTARARTRNFLEWLESRENVSAFGEITETTGSGW